MRLEAVITKIADAIESFPWERWISGAITAFEWAFKLFDMLGGVEGLVVLLSTAFSIKLAKAVFDLGMAFKGLFTILMANPLMAFLGVLATVAMFVILNWDEVKAFFLELFDIVSAKCSEFVSYVSAKWESLKESAWGVVEFIKSIGENILEFLIWPYKTAFEYITSKFESISSYVPDWLKDMLGGQTNVQISDSRNVDVPRRNINEGMNGSMRIEVSTAGGAQASVVDASMTGGDLSVRNDTAYSF